MLFRDINIMIFYYTRILYDVRCYNVTDTLCLYNIKILCYFDILSLGTYLSMSQQNVKSETMFKLLLSISMKIVTVILRYLSIQRID